MEVAATWYQIEVFKTEDFNNKNIIHMGREHASREKKLPMVIFLIFVHKNVYIRFQKVKIGGLEGENRVFLTFTDEKTTFQCSKVVSEAIFPTNKGYVFIEKWS